jgi:hypothetical protein
VSEQFVVIQERWTHASGERKIGDGPWEPIDLRLYDGKPPFAFLSKTLQPKPLFPVNYMPDLAGDYL